MMKYKMAEFKDIPDTELTPYINEGNTQAFTELYKRYSQALFDVSYAMLKDEDIAKDIVQEVFTYLWYNHKSISFHKNISAYLFRSIRNNVLTHISTSSNREKHIDSLKYFMDQSSSITDDSIIENELTRIIDNEILKLPPRMRKVFELSRNEQLSYKEIAELLNISEETVRKQMHRALKILRKRIVYSIILFF